MPEPEPELRRPGDRRPQQPPEPEPEPEPQSDELSLGGEVWLGNIPCLSGSSAASLGAALAASGLSPAGYGVKKYVKKASKRPDGTRVGYAILKLPPGSPLVQRALALDGCTVRLPCGTEFVARARSAAQPGTTAPTSSRGGPEPPLSAQLAPILGPELCTRLRVCLADTELREVLRPFGLHEGSESRGLGFGLSVDEVR